MLKLGLKAIAVIAVRGNEAKSLLSFSFSLFPVNCLIK